MFFYEVLDTFVYRDGRVLHTIQEVVGDEIYLWTLERYNDEYYTNTETGEILSPVYSCDGKERLVGFVNGTHW